MPPNDFSGLGANSVHVWVVPLDDPDKRVRRNIAHAAEREILAAYLEVAPETLEFSTLPGGKPVVGVVGGTESPALEFNISHSGKLALVAVSRNLPVGVDLERKRTFRNELGLAQRICTARELEHLSRADDADELLRLWVRKEAVVKATGEGLARPLDQLDVLEREVDGDWACVDLPYVGTSEISGKGYRAAVALPCRPGVNVSLRGAFSWEADPRR